MITPNPKTSGGARWNYLAAWGYAPRPMPGGSDGQEVRRRSLPECTGARHRCARFDRDLRPARRRRRAAGLGERGLPGPRRTRSRRLRNRQSVAFDPGRTAGCRRRCQCRQEGHPRYRRGISEVPLFRGRPGPSRPPTTTARSIRTGRQEDTTRRFPKVDWPRSRCSADGQKRSPNSSAMVVYSIRSTHQQRASNFSELQPPRAGWRRDSRAPCRVSGLTMGLPLTCFSLIVFIPLVALGIPQCSGWAFDQFWTRHQPSAPSLR